MLPDDDQEPLDSKDRDAFRHRIAERILPELIKKVVEAGALKLAEQPEHLRNFVQEHRLPKEIGNLVFSQIDETKNGLYRVVAKEIRDFLEHTNFAEELTKVLTRLSFEVRTEVRFIPNEKGSSLFPKPNVKSEVAVKRAAGKAPRKPSKKRK